MSKHPTTILPVAALAAALIILGAPLHAQAAEPHGTPPILQVVKTPTCGCCGAWIDLARQEDFDVEVSDTEDFEGMKQETGVPEALWACHTARIGGYIVEGHVPFVAIERPLAERPETRGISVPGMPAGSPGMGSDPDAAYDVIAFGGTAGDGAVFLSVGR